MKKKLLSSPFLAALLGGGIVAAVMLLAGVGNTTLKTVVQESAAGTPADAGAAAAGQLTPRQIYQRDAPGVVYVTATVIEQSQSPFQLFPTNSRGVNTGSGFVIDRNGTILTNAHVINGAVKITVAFANNQTVTAKVIGKDPDDDLALLKVNPDGLTLVPLPLGDSSTVEVGDPTFAIGNPFGLPRSLTTGVVSALQRSIQAPNNFGIDNVIQTDAPLNPGNSGGPLINAQGQVIGINSQIETGTSGNGSVGIGFAIPINTALAVIPQIERTGKVTQGYLGITTIDVDPALATLHLHSSYGALIQTIQSGSPAARAGLRAGDLLTTLPDGITQVEQGGDIIVAVDGRRISGATALENAIIADHPGQVVKLAIVRGTKQLTVTVKLGTRPYVLPTP
ncbi:MAG TPA: trypsin-like peptidase domain-containing protein [Solirubrobacteraceae bacterium]|nr:trypsin-like peptidase domain-containing protein [Solirubrobacteraceae bacterium]